MFNKIYGKFPTCAAVFKNRIFYAVDNLLAWTAENTIGTLISEGGAGYKEFENCSINSLCASTNILSINTNEGTYIWTGIDNDTWICKKV